MMPISHLLEDFGVAKEMEAPMLMSENSLEDLRLASFEQGYSAGWDDAIRAQAEDQTRITGALGSALSDLSFTYHEALSQMISSVEPVFCSLVESVLPEAMIQTVGMQIAQQCSQMAQDQVAQPLFLAVPVGTASAIKPMLQQDLAMQVDITECAEMKPGQVRLKIGDREREIDSDLMLSALRESIDAFFFNAKKANSYG